MSLFEIEDQETVTILAVRHQREEGEMGTVMLSCFSSRYDCVRKYSSQGKHGSILQELMHHIIYQGIER